MAIGKIGFLGGHHKVANKHHLDIFDQGIEKWNKWREEHPEIQPDLSGLTGVNTRSFVGTNLSRVNLSHTNLSRSNFRYSDCVGTNFEGANLMYTMFLDSVLRDATLRNANLSGADLTLATLTHADLSDANLSGAVLDETSCYRAKLFRTNLSSAIFSKVNFTEASIGWSLFNNIDLSNIKGLETVYHLAPSSIDISTIYRSKGKVPDIFLLNAGVPKIFLQLGPFHVPSSEHTTYVISFAHEDEFFAKKLLKDLSDYSIHCWFSSEDMKVMNDQGYLIDESVKLYDKLLLVISTHSLQREWVKHEQQNAFIKSQYLGYPQVLFPICLDQVLIEDPTTWSEDLSSLLNSSHNFQHWKSDEEYQRALELLVEVLKEG